MFKYAGVKDWSSLPNIITEMTSINNFELTLNYFLKIDNSTHTCSLKGDFTCKYFNRSINF